MPKFEPIFEPQFLDQQASWHETNPTIAAKVRTLVSAILEDPVHGIGKPEPLKSGPFKGCWIRRITEEHRIVYKVDKGTISFLMCRYHY